MPTYVLEGAGRAVFPRRPIVVAMTVAGPETSATIDALVSGVADARAVRPTAGLMVLPRIDAPTILRITPSGRASAFPNGTTVHLSLTVEDRSDPDTDRAVIGPIDVSGEAHVDVVSLDSQEDGIAIAALRSEPDIDLGPVANQARSAARLAFGVDQLPERDQIDVMIAVDCSASMLSTVADGALALVCEVIVGISTVISPRRVPTVCLIGTTPVVVDVGAIGELSGAVDHALRHAYLVAGFRSSLVPISATGGETVTFIVTDCVPPGYAESTHPPSHHLIALTDDQQAGATTSASTFVRRPPSGTEVGRQLASSRDVVPDMIRSLVGAVAAGRRDETATVAG